MTQPARHRPGRSVPMSVKRESIRVGALLAEGGEGRVFELPLQPHLVFKEYRRAADRAHLEELVRWPDSDEPELLSRVRSAASWPEAIVERGGPPSGPGANDAVGVLAARAPRRFSIRHRDGTTRLATLSYLTADPSYREVAYGIALPSAFAPERLGLVYALARVLEALQTLEPQIGHGDLSAKNVLWSLQRGPEVFLIDCDNCERYGPDRRPLSVEGRRRAMTPNWDDPAVPAGANPGLTSDRYSLALIFLRVVGAANFPVQARQRQGGSISIDFPIPRGYVSETLLGSDSQLWELCARGLSTESVEQRPTAREWVSALGSVLEYLGAEELMQSVRSLQGTPAGEAVATSYDNGLGQTDASGDEAGGDPRGDVETHVSGVGPRDVSVRPVAASTRAAPPSRLLAIKGPQGRHRSAWTPSGPVPPATVGGSVTTTAEPPSEPVMRQIGSGAAVAFRWWLEAHRSALRGRSGSRDGPAGTMQRVAVCTAVDLAIGLFGLFLVAMAVAPILGL